MSLHRLFLRYAITLPSGTLKWIGVRPEKKQPLIALDKVMAIKHKGLEGDHRCIKTPNSARQVTLISEEFIWQIAYYCNKSSIAPALLRRNLVVSGINLNALRYQQFRIGDAIFEASALCHPCSRMEAVLGHGGVSAMLGHGGLCCKIIKSGEIKLGDSVDILNTQQDLF
jgi:MOSC domain-containing protein YiiM